MSTDAKGWKGRPAENPSPLGPITERFRRLENRVSDLETSAPLQSATISKGGLTVKDGGGIRAEYEDGSPAIHFGPIFNADGTPQGIGLHVQAPDDGTGGVLQGHDVFRAMTRQDGTTAVVLGETDNAIGYLWGLVGYATLLAATGDLYLESNTGWGTLKGKDAWLEATSGTTTVKGSVGLTIDSGGQVLIKSATSKVFLEHLTTSAGANCVIGTGGLIERSTSSLRYKQDVEDLVVDVADVLKLRPRTWRDRADVAGDPDVETRYVGFIAEELDEAGLTQWVLYDEQGRPDAIAYDRLTAALVPVVQDQQARLDDQAQQIVTLAAQLDELRALVTPQEA
ncbi:tail fiber domain-containing protein [Cellulosimicrobium protaetiae]